MPKQSKMTAAEQRQKFIETARRIGVDETKIGQERPVGKVRVKKPQEGLNKAKSGAERIRQLVDGMRAGDALAMEAFFTFIDGLKAKKLGKDGEVALTVVASVVELLLPTEARLAYSVAAETKNKKVARSRNAVVRKKRPD